MSKFYVYVEDTLEYLGELEAISFDVAQQLASELWRKPLKLTTTRLRRSQLLAV